MGLPKRFAFVFSMLIIRPEHRLNLFNNFRVYLIDFRSCSSYQICESIIMVSSTVYILH